MQFVCWLWRGKGFWKKTAQYDAGHVAVLASMLRRHGGHDLICVTPDENDVPAGVGHIRMPDDVAALPDYLPKLWAWSPEFHGAIGGRFASIDLDVVITADPARPLRAGAPLVIWGHAAKELYNTSLFALDPGFANVVWGALTWDRLERAKRQAAYWTGDQSWVAHVLGPGQRTFGEETGVMQYRPKLHREAKPAGMKAGFMCGPYCPRTEAEASPWVREAWQ